jgi:hypothetical protein
MTFQEILQRKKEEKEKLIGSVIEEKAMIPMEAIRITNKAKIDSNTVFCF